MKKFKLKPPSEHHEQVLVCKYLNLLGVFYYSIPNGFKYHGILKMIQKSINSFLYNKVKIKIFKEVKEMKAEGMKSGIPDICICEARKNYHGLYIEMKNSEGGTVSKEQKQKITALNNRNYRAVVCKGFKEAKKEIDDYFK